MRPFRLSVLGLFAAVAVLVAVVPAVVLVAVITFAVWGLIGPEPRFSHALINAIASGTLIRLADGRATSAAKGCSRRC